MIKEEKSIFRKILKSNVWLLRSISENTWINEITIRQISLIWRWNNKSKNKIINFLVGNNYIRDWEYTITELFEIK